MNEMKQKKLKEAIEKEIEKLMDELQTGTLHRKKLEAGLEKLQKYVIEVPWFRPEKGGKKPK